MKYAANPDTWIFGSVNSICQQTDHKTYVNTVVDSCEVKFHGTFAEANVSIVSIYSSYPSLFKTVGRFLSYRGCEYRFRGTISTDVLRLKSLTFFVETLRK